jgi:hypothetical protein
MAFTREKQATVAHPSILPRFAPTGTLPPTHLPLATSLFLSGVIAHVTSHRSPNRRAPGNRRNK